MQTNENFEDFENLDAITSKLDQSFRERRRYPRIDYIFDVKYEVLPSTTKEETITKGKDISLGGVSFELKENQDIKIGMFLVVKFSIKELSGELKAMGKVVRTWKEMDNNQKKERKFCAVKFTAVDPTDYEILNNFIREHLSNK
jgi:c-di-GMP-binding flagellar brake protein YcgR